MYSNGDGAAAGGKRYVEVAVTGKNQAFGIGNNWRRTFTSQALGLSTFQSEDQYMWALWLKSDNTLQVNHNGVGVAQGSYTYVAGAPVMIAVDFDAGLMWLGYNGTWVGGGDPVSGTNPTYTGLGGYPHPVTILGSMSASSTDVLHATLNNQLFRPSNFQPWEDFFGSDVTATLVGQKVTVQKNTFDIFIFTDPDISLSLRGLPSSVQLGAITIDLGRPKVTWNPNDHSQYVALTDANMGVVSFNPPDHSTYMTRATVGRAVNTGKYYFEVTVPFVQDDINVDTSEGPGIAISPQYGDTQIAQVNEWGGFLTKDYASPIVRERWFNLAADGSSAPVDPIHGGRAKFGDALGEFVPGRVLQLAVDFNAGKIWFGYNGKWFNSSNGADPATGTLPQYSNIRTVITTVAFQEYPSFWPDYLVGQPAPPPAIGHFSLASFVFDPPAGFVPWEEGNSVDRVGRLTTQALVAMQGQLGTIGGVGAGALLVGQELTVQPGPFVSISRTVQMTGLQLAVRTRGFIVKAGPDVQVPLAMDQQLALLQGVADWRVTRMVQWIRVQPTRPYILLYIAFDTDWIESLEDPAISPNAPPIDGSSYSPLDFGGAVRTGPPPGEQFTGFQTNGDVLNWQGKRRYFEIPLFLGINTSFYPQAYVGVCPASHVMELESGMPLDVHVFMTRIGVNPTVPDTATITVNNGTPVTVSMPRVDVFQANVNILVAVDFGVVSGNNSGAYWVGVVPYASAAQWPWGNPVLGAPPMGYLFSTVPSLSDPLVIQTGLGAGGTGVYNAAGHLGIARTGITAPPGFIAWDEEGPDNYYLQLGGQQLGLQLQTQQGYFVGLEPPLYRQGQQATVQQGAMLPILGTAVALTGLQATVKQGKLQAARSAVLVGRQATVQQGTLTPVRGASLVGQRLTVARGALVPGRIVALTGRQLSVQRGTLKVSMGATLAGTTLTTGMSALAPSSTRVLAGLKLSLSIGKLQPGLAVAPVGRQLIVTAGTLKVALRVKLAGQQVTVVRGVQGIQSDANVHLRGMKLTVQAGAFPIIPVPSDWLLWVLQKAADEKMRESEDDVFVDEEPVE